MKPLARLLVDGPLSGVTSPGLVAPSLDRVPLTMVHPGTWVTNSVLIPTCKLHLSGFCFPGMGSAGEWLCYLK